MRDVVDKPIHTPINFAVNQTSFQEDDSSSADEVTPLITRPVSSYMSEDGASKIKRRGKDQNALELAESVRCDCHEPPKSADKRARNRLIVACIIVLLFMIGEIIGNVINYKKNLLGNYAHSNCGIYQGGGTRAYAAGVLRSSSAVKILTENFLLLHCIDPVIADIFAKILL